jgi:hypothetical protein
LSTFHDSSLQDRLVRRTKISHRTGREAVPLPPVSMMNIPRFKIANVQEHIVDPDPTTKFRGQVPSIAGTIGSLPAK